MKQQRELRDRACVNRLGGRRLSIFYHDIGGPKERKNDWKYGSAGLQRTYVKCNSNFHREDNMT